MVELLVANEMVGGSNPLFRSKWPGRLVARTPPVGVAQIGGASGDAINVCVFGVSRVVAGGTITAGTNFFVMPGTGGKAYAYDGAGANAQIIAGRFLPNVANTAASANEEVEILVSVSLGV